MRKFIAVIIGLFSILFISSVRANAEEAKYGNLVTDETSIEEDFKLLSIDINEYYKPSYNYEKWYVIGMSEAFVDTENYDIQTYFYIYNPTSPKSYEYYYQDNDDVGEEHYNYIDSFSIDYTISSTKKTQNTKVLSINYDHHIYKVKGFTYKYQEYTSISITSIQNYMPIGAGIKSDSGFKATCNHSKLNGFQVELNFNTTLIIDEKEAVVVKIAEENPYYSTWNSFWEYFWASWKNEYKLVFYNFNFPKNIKPDSIEYAKFQYIKEVEYKKYHRSLIYEPSLRDSKKESSKDIHEYLPGTFKIQVNSASTELDFPTFYLGDRIKDKQFGYLEFEEEDKKKFNYQASILLDCLTDGLRTSTGIRGDDLTGWHLSDNEYMERYESVKNIEFLELHYKKDGILYKCQIVSQPEDPSLVDTSTELPTWQKILLWIGKFILKTLQITVTLPDWIIMMIGGAVALLAAVIILALLPLIINLIVKIIKIPLDIIKS